MRIEPEFKKAVWEQGFSLEQNVFRILEKEGWQILPNRNFFDSLRGLTREFDLLAYKAQSYFGVTLFTVIIIECKFNPHRIVFYVRSLPKEQFSLPQYYVGDFVKKLIKPEDFIGFFRNIRRHKSFFISNEQIFGYQMFEKIEIKKKNTAKQTEKQINFKTRQELSEKTIFDAINTVVQATKYEQQIRDNSRSTGDFIMFFPIVIFSGGLYKGSLVDRKTLKQQKMFRYRTGMAQSDKEMFDEFDIHICDISAFTNLIKALSYSHGNFWKFLARKIKDKK